MGEFSLLQQGNSKLGRAIFAWSVPAIETCPGASALCRAHCYALKSRFRFAKVKAHLAWCLDQSRRDDFVERMCHEIRSNGVLVLRVHVAGDFGSVEYAEKWLAIMKRCPRVRFYLYSRSWRVPAIAKVLEKMAALSCTRIWYSADDETGIPEVVPKRVRLAFLQVKEADHPKESDLVFRIRKLRKLASLPIVCDAETKEGKALGTTCGSCARCFQ
jgi:hypothetical protein